MFSIIRLKNTGLIADGEDNHFKDIDSEKDFQYLDQMHNWKISYRDINDIHITKIRSIEKKKIDPTKKEDGDGK